MNGKNHFTVKLLTLYLEDAPVKKENHVVTIGYHDENLNHNVVTVRSVDGVIHFVNKTPMDCCSKTQSTVETDTYGSEHSSSLTCLYQILDIKITLRRIGAPILLLSCMFGENKSVVDSNMTPNGKIHKLHIALSFHRVRESISSEIVNY